jgi:hypothetical protein
MKKTINPEEKLKGEARCVEGKRGSAQSPPAVDNHTGSAAGEAWRAKPQVTE